MPTSFYLIDRSAPPMIDGVQAMLLAVDDASREAILDQGLAAARARGIALPPGYFDRFTLLSASTAAGWSAIFGGR